MPPNSTTLPLSIDTSDLSKPQLGITQLSYNGSRSDSMSKVQKPLGWWNNLSELKMKNWE